MKDSVNSETERKYKRTHYFALDPLEWIEVLIMEDKEAGKLFKKTILQLSQNDVPEESKAYPMFQRTLAFREKQRERIMKRWQQQQEQEQQQAPQQPQQPVVRPPRPRIPTPQRVQPPDMRDVYDFCDANNILPTTGREWYEYMEAKGWNSLKSQWQNALKGFAKKKEQ